MIEINFRYQGKDSLIKCYESELIEDVCEKFAKDNALDLDNLYFFYKGEKINFHLGLFVEQQYSLKNNSSSNETKRMDIDIYEESPFYMKFFYNGTSRPLKIDRNEKLREAFKRYSKKYCIDLKKVYFFYNTKIYYFNKLDEIKINEIINSTDQTEKAMSIFVYDDDTISKYSEKNNIDNKISIEDENFDTSLIIENDDKEAPFIIKFFYKGPPCILNVKENEKMSDIFFRYSEKVAIDLTRVSFFYNKKYYAYDKIGDKILKEIISDKDKIDKILSITVSEFEKNLNKNQNIIEDNNTDLSLKEDNELEENLLDKATIKLNKMATKKSFYTNNFIILIIQHVLILLFYFLGFFYEMNESILNPYINIASIILQISICIFFIIFFFLNRLYENKNGYYMIIFLVFYPFIVIYYSFLLSKYIDGECIMAGLSFFCIEIFSLIINVMYLKKFELLYFGLCSTIPSFIALVLFSTLWKKTLFQIIFNSLFWLFSNIYYLFWTFISSKLCKLEEYFYSAIIFNYNIFIGLSYIITNGIKYTSNNIKTYLRDQRCYNIKWFHFKNFIILIIQQILILFVTFLGFYFEFNKIFLNLFTHIISLVLQISIFVFLVIFLLNIRLYNNKKKKYMILFYAFYPFIVIYYSFLLSLNIDYKCIIIGLLFCFIEILTMGFNLLIIKNYEIKNFGLSAIVFSKVGLILFSVLWIKSFYPIIYISLFWLYTNAHYTFWLFISIKICKLDESFYSIIIHNYTIFLGLAYCIKVGINNIGNIIRVSLVDAKKSFYLKNFLILIIQHFIIALLSFLGFYFGINQIFLNKYIIISYIILQIIILIIFIFNKMLYESPQKRYMYIFHIIYPFRAILLFFLLSQHFDYKCIMIGLFFILIEILSLGFNIISLDNYKLLYFGISSSLFSFIALILFSSLWVKDSFPIIYISLFWIQTNAYYLFWIFLTSKIELNELNNYFYSALIFDYGTIMGLTYIIKNGLQYIIINIKERIRLLNEQEYYTNDKRLYILESFLILFFQHMSVVLISFIGFFTGFYEIFANSTTNIIFLVFQILVVIFLAIFLANKECFENKNGSYMIILLIIYPIFIIYYSFLISQSIDYKYTIIGLSFILIEISIPIICIFYYNDYHLLIYAINSTIFSLVSFIIFSVLWIKDILPIIYTGLFWIAIDAYYILYVFLLTNILNGYGYIFSVITFNYYIYFLLAFVAKYIGIGFGYLIQYIGKGIKKILEDIKKRKEEGNASSEVFKLFLIFFIQYTIITVVVWIGIASGIERYLREGTTFMILMICNSIINLFLCIIFVYFVHYEKKGVGFCFYKYFYVPMMILYYFLFSTFIESDYILCFLFILFFELLFLVIFIFYFKIENFIIINAIGVIINTITILFFHFLWVQDGIVTRNISLITLSVDIYILVLGLVLFHFINDKNDKNYIEDFTNIAFNYGLFCLVFALAIALLALGIAIAIGTIGLICWICSCICENGCK